MKSLLISLALSITSLAALADNGMNHSHQAAEQVAQGVGVVKGVDAKASQITLAHEPIAALNWPAMTMPFSLSSPALAKGLKVGDKVRFELKAAGMNGTITKLAIIR